jgi:hypothetical protein
MALYKNSILDYVNSNVISHLNTYPDYSSFIVNLNRLDLVSDNNYHKVKFEIIYQNIFFDIFIVYDNGVIEESITINSNFTNQLSAISNFYDHFKSISKPELLTFFTMLNNAV